MRHGPSVGPSRSPSSATSGRCGSTAIRLDEPRPNLGQLPTELGRSDHLDVDATLDVARRLGATVVTEPTAFFGDTFSRFRDPWSNLWWVYRHGGQTWTDDAAAGEDWDQTSPELTYIHDTLLAAMQELRDPR